MTVGSTLNHNFGFYLSIPGKRIPIISVGRGHYSQTWKFWKYKTISPVDLYDFIFNENYVFWITNYGHDVFLNNYENTSLIEDFRKTIWISVCYCNVLGNILCRRKKYFKMSKVNFLIFYTPIIRNISLDLRDKKLNKIFSWKECGF